MEITIKGWKLHDKQKTAEEVTKDYLVPLCDQFRLHGFQVTEIKVEGLTS